MTNKRKALSQKTRFEVFKRDKFTCQYCGRIAPDVILEVDHIIPVAKGGQNDIMNLLTSCRGCNAGKKHRELSDDSVLAKQKKQLDDLEERRSQISMMVKWRNGLDKQDNELITNLIHRIENAYKSQYSVSDDGKKNIVKWLKKFSFVELCDAIDISANNYLAMGRDDKYSKSSVEKFFNYIPRVANFTKISKENPQVKDVYYIRKIVINRMWCKEWEVKHYIELAFGDGYDTNTIKKIACTAKNYSDWLRQMGELIGVEQ